jgi:hypothetical protein
VHYFSFDKRLKADGIYNKFTPNATEMIYQVKIGNRQKAKVKKREEAKGRRQKAEN